MLISEAKRRFGRNISNLTSHVSSNKENQVQKKKTIPRSMATVSLVCYQDSENCATVANVQQENPVNPVLPLQVIHKAAPVVLEEDFARICLREEEEDDEDESFTDDDTNDDDAMALELADMSLDDIDLACNSDPQFVTEYAAEIFSYLSEKERAVRIPHDYMKLCQKEVLPRHRDILVNWMCEVYLQLKLLSETLFLAVTIVDRLLSIRLVTKKKLHLVGLGALMIASKFEETYAPPLRDLRFCSDNAYSEDEMLRVERVILNALDFQLCIPTPLMFLRRYSKAAHSDCHTHTLSKYLSELSAISYDMLRFLPSEIAASCVFLARAMKRNYPVWTPNLEHYTNYTESSLEACVRALNNVAINEYTKASGPIFRKYANERLLAVARITPCSF